ncbi:MAG: ABC transporter ATP-binding protein [Eggerthellaceae bacterium]|jgi:iron complex transport system ATP-binding protein|nr:ABC transporter ATP-binding protein [Eggerthellaceae bacterium]MCH4220641.1 ABC transporter ATP-binding protein [Eggerthellaceae bacterium]
MKLEVRHASFGYRSHQVIEDLDFTVPDRSVLTVLGPNGVGKTTLLKCMMGFLKWDRGETRLGGKDLHS